MKIISFSDADQAFAQVSDYFEADWAEKNVVVTDAHKITERDFASGIVSPHADVIFWAQDKMVMMAICDAVMTMQAYSDKVQLVVQRNIGREYGSSLCFQNMTYDSMDDFVLASDAQLP